MPENRSARALHLVHRPRNVVGVLQAKTKMRDAASGSRPRGVALENKDIERTRPLDLDLVVIAVVLAHSERPFVNSSDLWGSPDRPKADVGQTVGCSHPAPPALAKTRRPRFYMPGPKP